MIYPGEDIRAARAIYAILYGENIVWDEVNVKAWMMEAESTRKRLGADNFNHTLLILRTIPTQIDTEILKLITKI